MINIETEAKDANSILDIAEKFREMEVKYELFHLKSKDGYYYWDIFRLYVHLNILVELGYFPETTRYINPSRKKWHIRILKAIKLFPLFLINELQFSKLQQKKYLFLFTSRYQNEKGDPEDSLMKDIYSQLKNNAATMELFRHKNFKWLKKNNTERRYFLYKLEMIYLLKRVNEQDWQSLSEIINKEFRIKVDWRVLFNTLLNNYRKEYHFFKKLLKKLNPEFLFFQYSPRGMVSAANDLGIKTIDIQHGVTNNSVVAYSYPRSLALDHLSSIPDSFLTLGQFWNERIQFPGKVVTVGNSYFHIKKSITRHNKKGILIVSVAYSHKELMTLTSELAKRHQDIIFYYKLHSGQKHQEKESRDYFKSYSNVIVVYTEKNVSEIMEDCFAIVLIQSTVTYQALQKGLKVFILKKLYYGISYDVFHLPGVYLFEDWDDLSSQLEKASLNTDETESTIFFEPYNPQALEEIIRQ